MKKKWTIQNSLDLYKIHNWGAKMFSVNKKGELTATPFNGNEKKSISILEVVKELQEEGIEAPYVIRFHDILHQRVQKINLAFKEVITEEEYSGKYLGVFPIKVNQTREVVEEIVEAGDDFDLGLEAGSKAELLSILAYHKNPDSLMICNGYKDKDFLRLACLGTKMGRKLIVVIEQFSELPLLLEIGKEMGALPEIGLRAKLFSNSSGKWEKSSGDSAKFGLTSAELLYAVELLKKNKLIEKLTLFHFHIGSQIPDIKTFHECFFEGGQIFAELCKLGAPMRYFDTGGGLGVDYLGQFTNNYPSINYTIKDYARYIVTTLKEICEREKVTEPSIITEAGRALTAHHSCVILNIFGEVSYKDNFNEHIETIKSQNSLCKKMKSLYDIKKSTRPHELFNWAIVTRSQAMDAFKMGFLSLSEKAFIEKYFWLIMEKLSKYTELHESLENKLVTQYLSNFSVFQSIPDSWAIDQLLPVVPIHRLNEEPTQIATLADITCDSDGKVNHFIGEDGEVDTTLLHTLKENESYFVGIFLTGAYQDVMGDNHNLMGRLSEAHVYYDEAEPTGFYIEEIVPGETPSDVLETLKYNPLHMCSKVKKQIDKRIKEGKIMPREGVKLIDFYEKCLKGSTYLNFK